MFFYTNESGFRDTDQLFAVLSLILMRHTFYNGEARDVALRRVRRKPTPGDEEKTACCPLLRINETPQSKQHAPYSHLPMHKKGQWIVVA